MDYWKDVPGIDEGTDAEGRSIADFQNLIGDLNSALGALKDLKTQVQRKNPASAKRARKTLGTSIKFIDTGLKSVFSKKSNMKESSGMDSNYLRDSLKNLIDDIKRDEKDLAKVLQWVWDRVNQSIPDGDVTSADIGEFLTEPSGRKLLKKSGESKADIADMILSF